MGPQLSDRGLPRVRPAVAARSARRTSSGGRAAPLRASPSVRTCRGSRARPSSRRQGAAATYDRARGRRGQEAPQWISKSNRALVSHSVVRPLRAVMGPFVTRALAGGARLLGHGGRGHPGPLPAQGATPGSVDVLRGASSGPPTGASTSPSSAPTASTSYPADPLSGRRDGVGRGGAAAGRHRALTRSPDRHAPGPQPPLPGAPRRAPGRRDPGRGRATPGAGAGWCHVRSGAARRGRRPAGASGPGRRSPSASSRCSSPWRPVAHDLHARALLPAGRARAGGGTPDVHQRPGRPRRAAQPRSRRSATCWQRCAPRWDRWRSSASRAAGTGPASGRTRTTSRPTSGPCSTQGFASTQRFSLGGQARMAVGVVIPSVDAAFVEVFTFDQLEHTLSILRNSLLAGTALVTAVGALLGLVVAAGAAPRGPGGQRGGGAGRRRPRHPPRAEADPTWPAWCVSSTRWRTPSSSASSGRPASPPTSATSCAPRWPRWPPRWRCSVAAATS